eukprot:5713359-Prymnesium_polylepis.1
MARSTTFASRNSRRERSCRLQHRGSVSAASKIATSLVSTSLPALRPARPPALGSGRDCRTHPHSKRLSPNRKPLSLPLSMMLITPTSPL